MDGKMYRRSSLTAYCTGGIYFIRNGDQFLKRIMAGPKLNVYANIHRTSITSGNYESPGHTYITTWLQRGEDGKLFRFGHESLANEVKDCPLAYELANKSSSELRKLTRAN